MNEYVNRNAQRIYHILQQAVTIQQAQFIPAAQQAAIHLPGIHGIGQHAHSPPPDGHDLLRTIGGQGPEDGMIESR